MDNKLKIINYLGKHIGERFTMHELSSLVDIPYASFHRTVHQMSDLLEIHSVGRAKTVSLRINNPIAKAHLIVSSDEERKEFLKNKPVIKKIVSELRTLDIVLLFGSYAKRKETGRSDIDILVINKEGQKTLSFSKYELLFKRKINPIFVTKKEFKDMLKDKEENIGKQALKNHIVLNNPEEFWGCVFDAV